MERARYAVPFDVDKHSFVDFHNSGRCSDWPIFCSQVVHVEI